MTVVTRFWWVRHAGGNTDGRIAGPEEPRGEIHPKALRRLADLLPREADWITSGVRRADETLAAILSAIGVSATPLVEPGFTEQDFGHWTGRRWGEVFSDAQAAERFWAAPAESRPRGGESFVEVAARVRAAVARLASGDRDLVIVAHAGSIRAAVAVALRLSPEDALSLAIDPCSITRLDHVAGVPRPGWRVVWVNRPSACRAAAL